MTGVRFDADSLTALGADVLRSHGVPADDAALVSDRLVTADLWGHPSHVNTFCRPLFPDDVMELKH